MGSGKKVTIGVVANRQKPGAGALLRELLAHDPAQTGIDFLVEKTSATLIRAPGVPLAQLIKKADFFLVAGGDGSILEFVRQIYPAQVPTLGLNLGSLGFLTALGQEELAGALPLLAKNKLCLSPRMALEATVHRGRRKEIYPCALNDVVISRGDLSRLVRLRVTVGRSLVTEYVCDGLIISTPTGSTAYSVSAGGPILHPGSRVIALTPICPHTLTNRSIVVGTKEPIRVEIPAQHSCLTLQLDGQSGGRLRSGDWIEIRPASAPVVLAFTPKTDFFTVLRQKLKWSGASV